MNTLTLVANLDALAHISAFITAAAEQSGLNERATWQVQLAIDEAATNIIQHAYEPDTPGKLTLEWHAVSDRFIVTLRDHGRTFDPQEVVPPDLESPLEERQIGGLGIYLMTRLMDEVHFDFDPQSGNLLTLVKYIQPETRDDIIVVPVAGRMDAITTPEINKQIHNQIDNGTHAVILDLSAVIFLSSSGLRALLLLRKELMTLGGELRLVVTQPQVYEVFEITGFAQVFAIHSSVEEACAACRPGRT